ncbi:hypothetical protein [Armatimonas sp.]|uniref:hypothetical protein n=1 Tax=Armatimonas sp. TaxID=1872638 RepID=UPI00286C3861|nr:hypothetical protein [Armatimonas sp.]
MENRELELALEAKSRRRQELAKLPIKKKIQMVIHLQKMAAPLLKQRGKIVYCWTED